MLLLELVCWGPVTPGTSALGVALGGTTQAQAAARLAPQLDAILGRPLELRYGSQSWSTTARDLGLTLDPDDLAQAAFDVGREGNPVARLSRQLSALAGGGTIAVHTAIDEVALISALA